jgi:hypothetical protein
VLEATLRLHIPHPRHWPDLAELRRCRTPRRLGEQAPDPTIIGNTDGPVGEDGFEDDPREDTSLLG